MTKICCDFFLLDKASYTDDINTKYLKLALLKASFIPSKQIGTILFEAAFLLLIVSSLNDGQYPLPKNCFFLSNHTFVL